MSTFLSGELVATRKNGSIIGKFCNLHFINDLETIEIIDNYVCGYMENDRFIGKLQCSYTAKQPQTTTSNAETIVSTSLMKDKLYNENPTETLHCNFYSVTLQETTEIAAKTTEVSGKSCLQTMEITDKLCLQADQFGSTGILQIQMQMLCKVNNIQIDNHRGMQLLINDDVPRSANGNYGDNAIITRSANSSYNIAVTRSANGNYGDNGKMLNNNLYNTYTVFVNPCLHYVNNALGTSLGVMLNVNPNEQTTISNKFIARVNDKDIVVGNDPMQRITTYEKYHQYKIKLNLAGKSEEDKRYYIKQLSNNYRIEILQHNNIIEAAYIV